MELFENGTVKDFVKKAKILARKGSALTRQKKYADAIVAY
jgi:hypothetical protein